MVHLHMYIRVTLPTRTWILIWHRGTGSYVDRTDWLRHHDNGLLENEIEVAWQTKSARLRVGSDVSICAMEIEWHDRWGQQGCMLDQKCLYAPIRNYESLWTKLRWHGRRGLYDCVLGRTSLYAPWRLSGMIDKVSTVACWIKCVYMHKSKNMNLSKRKIGWHDRKG